MTSFPARLEHLLHEIAARWPHRITIHPPHGVPMSSLALPNDVVATIPLIFTDQIGRTVAAIPGLTASSSDATIGTAEISADGALIVTPVAASGDFSVTLADGSLSASLDVSIVAPAATAISVDIAHATFAAKV